MKGKLYTSMLDDYEVFQIHYIKSAITICMEIEVGDFL